MGIVDAHASAHGLPCLACLVHLLELCIWKLECLHMFVLLACLHMPPMHKHNLEC
jgi:hypothetical protein